VTTLTAELRAKLAVVADVLVPAQGEMPRASEAGVPEAGIDVVLSNRPDLAAAVELIGAWPDGGEREALLALERDDRAAFAALLEAVAAAYFLDVRVSRLLGYRHRDAVPMIFDEDLDELVAPVVARGTAYRPVTVEQEVSGGL
jgi:hypothetical protein